MSLCNISTHSIIENTKKKKSAASSHIMRASDERISSLCSSLGHNSPDGYIPSDDCQINIDELAYSIWRDDEAQRNVSIQVAQLGIFSRDLIPALMLEDNISYVALKALTAMTYPPSPNVVDLDRHIAILRQYKIEASIHQELFAKVLEYVAPIIENPRADITMLNRAELAITLIRNILIVPSTHDIHEKVFQILYDLEFFNVIDLLKITRFGDRAPKFARLIAGVFYGCFSPFLPLKSEVVSTTSKAPVTDAISAFVNATKSKGRATRHGHWGNQINLSIMPNQNKGEGEVSIISKKPVPKGTKISHRKKLLDAKVVTPTFTKIAQIAAGKMMDSDNFKVVFDHSIPRSFGAYDRGFSVREQLQLTDMSRFFMDFTLKYGQEVKAVPLATDRIVNFFISVANYFLESKSLSLEGISPIQALDQCCSLFSSMCAFHSLIIRDSRRVTDVQLACSNVSKYASDLENILISMLVNITASKKTLSMVKNNVVALERLYKLYALAEEINLVRRRTTRRDEDANPDEIAEDRIDETYSSFTGEMIISRLVRKQNVLAPYFELLLNAEDLNEEEIDAIAQMLLRCSKKTEGLAHMLKLPYLYSINKVLQSKVLDQVTYYSAQELKEVLELIINRFFKSAMNNRLIFVSALIGVDVYELYDEERHRRREMELVNTQLGISLEVERILSEPASSVNVDDDTSFIVDRFDEPAHERPPPPRPKPRPVAPRPTAIDPSLIKKSVESESSSSDSDTDEELTIEQFKKAVSKQQRNKIMNEENKGNDEEMKIEDEESLTSTSTKSEESSQRLIPERSSQKVQESDDELEDE